MQIQDYQKIWDDICSQVQSYQEVAEPQIKAFFRRLHLQVISDGFIMITADNAFIKDYVEGHFLNYIDRALQDIYQCDFVISLEIDTTQQAAPIKPVQQPVTPARKTAPSNRVTITAPEEPNIATPAPKSKPKSRSGANIPSNLTFDNFVIGESNRMAYSMAVHVAENPGLPQFNPLFIYGKPGLGKTHLLRAIQNYVESNYNREDEIISTVYVDATDFLNDYTEASIEHSKEKSSFKNFKRKYEEADILLIDDLQVLQDKEQTLNIIFEIFKKFIDQGKQVVLSADRAPKNIDVDERYYSRFNQGATYAIQPPEVETKLGIVKAYLEECKKAVGRPDLEIPRDVQMYIAENSSSNIRELKSAVNRILTEMSINQVTDMDVDRASHLLENHFSGGATKRLTIADIQKQVESYFKLSHADMVSKRRKHYIVRPRQIAMYLCNEMLDKPYDAIGKEFGGKDHTTVIYSVQAIREKLKTDRDLQEEIDLIKKRIREE